MCNEQNRLKQICPHTGSWFPPCTMKGGGWNYSWQFRKAVETRKEFSNHYSPPLCFIEQPANTNYDLRNDQQTYLGRCCLSWPRRLRRCFDSCNSSTRPRIERFSCMTVQDQQKGIEEYGFGQLFSWKTSFIMFMDKIWIDMLRKCTGIRQTTVTLLLHADNPRAFCSRNFQWKP